MTSFGVFTNTQNWQYWHYCQLCIHIHLQFTSLFVPYDLSIDYVNLDASGYKRVIFQGCILHWSSSFLMAQLKQSWQYWHSCIAERLWKHFLPSREIINNLTNVLTEVHAEAFEMSDKCLDVEYLATGINYPLFEMPLQWVKNCNYCCRNVSIHYYAARTTCWTRHLQLAQW